jgi:hypothetical protein
MNFRFPFATTFAMLLATSLAAQVACPMQTTQHVPENLAIGPLQTCDGLSYEIIDGPGKRVVGTCPTFVVYTPPHEIAVPSANLTYVEVTGQLPITKMVFECTTRWLLILPIGTNCEAGPTQTLGFVRTMVTKPCAVPEEPGPAAEGAEG